jgi:hypothetical protein
MIELTIRTVDGSNTMDEGHMVSMQVVFLLQRRFGKYDGIESKVRNRLVCAVVETG